MCLREFSPLRLCSLVLEKLDEVDEELEDSGDSPDDGAHKQPSKYIHCTCVHVICTVCQVNALVQGNAY